MTKTLYLNRGLPGSGKSTRTGRMTSDFLGLGIQFVVCSSDDFHVCHCCGKYDFRMDRLPYAHQWCQAKCKKAVEAGVDVVIIDNTNCSARECRPYVEMGLANNYKIVFLEPETSWAFDIDQLVVKNTHNVPREGLERMLARWVDNMTVEKALGLDQPGKMTPDEKAAGRVS